MRIVVGRFKGKHWDAPKGLGTRPTSDRVREALFNVLIYGAPGIEFEGVRVLDLFAGSGALGLEAVSRGAAIAFSSRRTRAPVVRSAAMWEGLGLTGVTKIWRRDATRLGPAGNMPPFGLVFCDPPYGKGLGARAMQAAMDGGWLAPGRNYRL